MSEFDVVKYIPAGELKNSLGKKIKVSTAVGDYEGSLTNITAYKDGYLALTIAGKFSILVNSDKKIEVEDFSENLAKTLEPVV